jgi:hypothetical protein
MTFRNLGATMINQYTMKKQSDDVSLKNIDSNPFPLDSEMSYLLNNVLEFGYTVEPTGHFLCGYKKGQLNEKDVREITEFLTSHHVFCTPTEIVDMKSNQYEAKYLAFNKNKEDLTMAFRNALEAEALKKKSACCQIS